MGSGWLIVFIRDSSFITDIVAKVKFTGYLNTDECRSAWFNID